MAERIASRVAEHVTERLSSRINQLEDRFCFLLGVKMDDQESIDQFQADRGYMRSLRKASEERAKTKANMIFTVVIGLLLGVGGAYLTKLLHLGSGG